MKKALKMHRGIAAAAVACLGTVCMGEGIDPAYTGMAMFGVDGSSNSLTRFDFPTGVTTNVGLLRTNSDVPLHGIEASAYIPGFRNLFAFWQDPADGQTKLMYVNTSTAVAAQVGASLGHGGVRGAVAVNQAGTGWNVYVTMTEGKEPTTLDGGLNINPNEDPDCSFVLRIPDGKHPEGGGFEDDADDLIVISDLRALSPVSVNSEGEGTYYEGDACFIHVQPKGAGEQNTLTVGGDTDYPVFNKNTYDIATHEMPGDPTLSMDLVVRVYNTKMDPTTGRAMGKWRIEIDASSPKATIEISCGVAGSDGTPGFNPENKLIVVNHRTGAKTEVMSLDRAYDSLASTDGVVFYGYSEKDLYCIDTAAGTETLVGTTDATASLEGFEFAGTTVMGYDTTGDTLRPVDTSSASTMGTPAALPSVADQTTIVFMPLDVDPDDDTISFD